VALASGFRSTRRFNDAFAQTYRRPPRDLRRSARRAGASEPGEEVVLRLAYRPPYDWPHMLSFLATRTVTGVERVDARGYARTVVCDGGAAIVRVNAVRGADALQLRVSGAPAASLLQLASVARRVFDLAADPARIRAELAADPLVGPLVRQRPGLRIPGTWDPFECAVRAVLGQQVSVAAGRTFASRLTLHAGAPVRGGTDGLTRLFPTPERLVDAPLDGIGLTGARVRTLRALARATLDGDVDFAATAAELAAALTAVPGIGPWTAQYVLLRALGEPDALPSADLVLRQCAATSQRLLSGAQLEERAQRWQPWRGYAVMHLWASAAAQGATPAHLITPARKRRQQ
jgi:AraC family transcriptional regulator of adaptative response / DNA-3-methyladenine glycosylase II